MKNLVNTLKIYRSYRHESGLSITDSIKGAILWGGLLKAGE